MKYKKSIEKYFEKRIERIDYFLRLKPKNYKTETYHKLRTEVKKVNAVFEMIKFCDHDFRKNKTYHSLKKIFTLCGLVRDLQVETSFFKKQRMLNKKSVLMHELQRRTIDEKKKFIKQMTPALKQGVLESILTGKKVLCKINENQLEMFFKKQEKATRKLLSHKLHSKGIHEIRKELKSYYYCLKAASIGKKFLVDQLNRFQEIVGDWHDARNGTHFLKNISKKEINSKTDKNNFIRMRERLRIIEKRLMKEINKQWGKMDWLK